MCQSLVRSPYGVPSLLKASTRLFFTPRRNSSDRIGKFIAAVRKLQPGRHAGPRRVLSDNESFLSAKLVRPLYARRNVRLTHIPSHSPDLNPIDSFWGWLRGELRRRDLEDLRLKKPALNKSQYKQRVQGSERCQGKVPQLQGCLSGICRKERCYVPSVKSTSSFYCSLQCQVFNAGMQDDKNREM